MDLIVTLRLGYDGPSNCASTIKINNAENGLRVLFATLWIEPLSTSTHVPPCVHSGPLYFQLGWEYVATRYCRHLKSSSRMLNCVGVKARSMVQLGRRTLFRGRPSTASSTAVRSCGGC